MARPSPSTPLPVVLGMAFVSPSSVSSSNVDTTSSPLRDRHRLLIVEDKHQLDIISRIDKQSSSNCERRKQYEGSFSLRRVKENKKKEKEQEKEDDGKEGDEEQNAAHVSSSIVSSSHVSSSRATFDTSYLLQCIFEFVDLRRLRVVGCINKLWHKTLLGIAPRSEAVQIMGKCRMYETQRPDGMNILHDSTTTSIPVAFYRHITTVALYARGYHSEFPGSGVAVLSVLPNLTSLQCMMHYETVEEMVYAMPLQLKRLDIIFHCHQSDEPKYGPMELGALICTITRLASLTELNIKRKMVEDDAAGVLRRMRRDPYRRKSCQPVRMLHCSSYFFRIRKVVRTPMSRSHMWVRYFHGSHRWNTPPKLFRLMPSLITLNGKERNSIPTAQEEEDDEYEYGDYEYQPDSEEEDVQDDDDDNEPYEYNRYRTNEEEESSEEEGEGSRDHCARYEWFASRGQEDEEDEDEDDEEEQSIKRRRIDIEAIE